MSDRGTSPEELALIESFLRRQRELLEAGAPAEEPKLREPSPRRKLDRHKRGDGPLHPKFVSRRPTAPPPPPAPPKIPHSCRKWQTVDWYELPLYAGGRVLVPEGCLVTGGDRAWRREEST